jgi:hypothetical protein
VSVPFIEIFLVLFGAYLFFSEWIGLDSRYPILLAIVLLAAAALSDALGDLALATVSTEYALLVLTGGLFLLIVAHFREDRRGNPKIPTPPLSEPPAG